MNPTRPARVVVMGFYTVWCAERLGTPGVFPTVRSYLLVGAWFPPGLPRWGNWEGYAWS